MAPALTYWFCHSHGHYLLFKPFRVAPSTLTLVSYSTVVPNILGCLSNQQFKNWKVLVSIHRSSALHGDHCWGGGVVPTFTTCPRRFIPVHEEFFQQKQTVPKNLKIDQIESVCHHAPRFHMFVVSYYSCSNGSTFRQSFLKKIWRSKDYKIVRGSWTLQRIMVSSIRWVQYQDKAITSTRSLRCSINTSEVNRTTNVSIWKICSVKMKIYTYAQRSFIITCE